MKIIRLPNLKANLEVYPHFGMQVRQAREECGLSQKELAKILGHTSTWLSLIEAGKRSLSCETAWCVSKITNKKFDV